MGCSHNPKNKKIISIFEPLVLLSKKGNGGLWGGHSKGYLLLNNYLLMQISQYYLIYDLKLSKEIYRGIFKYYGLFTSPSNDIIFAVGRGGKEILLLKISTKQKEIRTFPEQRQPFHDILSFNENKIIMFHPNLLIIYEISTEKKEEIKFDNMRFFPRYEFEEGNIIKVNEKNVVIFYIDIVDGEAYNVIDITTKQIICKLKLVLFSHFFINVKTGRVSTKDNKIFVKSKNEIKYILLNRFGKLVIDYEYYDDIIYMREHKIIERFSIFFKVVNEPIYIIKYDLHLAAFDSKLKQIVQKISIEECNPYINYGWFHLEYSGSFLMMAYHLCYATLKIDIKRNSKEKRNIHWNIVVIKQKPK